MPAPLDTVVLMRCHHDFFVRVEPLEPRPPRTRPTLEYSGIVQFDPDRMSVEAGQTLPAACAGMPGNFYNPTGAVSSNDFGKQCIIVKLPVVQAGIGILLDPAGNRC